MVLFIMSGKNCRQNIIVIIIFFFLSISAQAQSKVQLSGYVLADESKECLIGAVVSSDNTWTVTNEYGFFSIKLEQGEHNIKCSYLGRYSNDRWIFVEKDTLISINMLPVEYLDNVVVEAESGQKHPSSFMGVVDIPNSYIKEMPAVFGEADLLKTIQKMPGVQSGMEGFSGIYVRGGGSEENLLLLDGAPVYNSSHLLGLLSTFTPEAVKQVTMYKGFFPAKYGGRASSVIDVRTKEGNAKSLHGVLSAGLIDDRVYVEGPVFKDRTSFSMSARGMNTFILYPAFKILNSPYFCSFYDLTGKLTHRFNDSDRLYFSLYHGKDKFDYSKSSSSEFSYVDKQKIQKTGVNRTNQDYCISWGNTTADLRWNHIFVRHLFSDLSLSWSNYEMQENTFQEDVINMDQLSGYSNRNEKGSGISDLIISWDLEMYKSKRQSVSFGLSHILHSFIPKTSLTQQVIDQGKIQDRRIAYNNEDNISLAGNESSVYIEDDINNGDKFNAGIGIRGTLFHTSGKTYYSLEPRFTAEYKILPTVSVKGSYSKMSQYVHLLASGNMSLPTDLWVPITKQIKPVFSNQYSIGVYYSGLPFWAFSVESYYKREFNILEYKDSHLAFTNSVDWEQAVEMGEGTSKGVELFIQKMEGSLTGMVAYTLSKTDRAFPEGTINSGRPFPFTYDRRHVVDFYLKYEFSDKVSINGAWTYSSGNMITASWRSMAILGPGGDVSLEPYISGRNNFRLPSSHRMDVSIDFKKEINRGIRVWTIGLYNAYCAMNPNWVVNDTDFIYGEYGPQGLYHYLSKRTLLPIIPSLSYSFSF